MAHRFCLAAKLARNPLVPLRARLPLVVLLMYLAMPLDIIPDFIPVIGQLDDVLVAGAAVWWFPRVCPADVAMDEIERLEQTQLSAVGWALLWLLGALMLVLFALTVLWFIHR